VLIGPFVDSGDGVTVEDGLTIDAADIRLSVNGGNIAAKNSGGGTHDELGYYTITLDATDTATVGRLQVMVAETGALPVYHEFQVLEEAIYDGMFAASAARIPADVTAISGDTTAADNAESFFDGTGYAGTNNVIPTVTSVTAIATGGITAGSIAADAIGASELAADAVTEIQSGLATAAALATAQSDLDTITGSDGAVIASGTQTFNMTGNVTGNLSGSVGSVTGAINTGAGTITTLDALDTAQDTQHGTTQTAIADVPTVAEFEARTIVSANYATSAALATVDQNVDSILEDTGTTLQAELDGIQADTEDIQSRLPAALVSGRIDASVGAMAANTLTASALATDAVAEINATVDTALSDYDGPTNAELTTALAAADDAVLAAIAALNNLSAADVNTQVLDVLNTDTFAEPTGVPGATVSIVEKIGRLYMVLRNRVDVTATKKTFYDDAGNPEWEQDLSDDATTFSQSEANSV
jgi:hypothetical protein